MSQGPWITDETKQDILRKLEPHLKSGLSIRKSCLNTGVSNVTVSKIMAEDEEFRNKIELFQSFLSTLTTGVFSSLLITISNKMAISNQAKKDYKEGRLTKEKYDEIMMENIVSKEELDLLKWHSLNSRVTKEEYGERKDIGLPDAKYPVLYIVI